MPRALATLLLLGAAGTLAAQAPARPGAARPAAPSATPASTPNAARAIPVQMGVRVLPETVTVGDPFVVTVRVRIPRGARVEWPAGPDSASRVELLDPRRLSASADTLEQMATWRMAAWDVGELPLAMMPVVVTLGAERRVVPLSDLRVTVASVLPADSSQRVPKPPRPPIEIPRSLWWMYLLGALLAALIAWLVWRWLQRRRQARPELVLDPYEYAEREFERVEKLGLVDAGERGRYVALVVEVLRDYLARRVEGAPASLTSTELLARLQAEGRIPLDRLAPMLAEADLIKFARRPVSAERARAIGTDARAIVREVQDAWARRQAVERAAGASAGRAAREAA